MRLVAQVFHESIHELDALIERLYPNPLILPMGANIGDVVEDSGHAIHWNPRPPEVGSVAAEAVTGTARVSNRSRRNGVIPGLL
jgi:hypothetical protein